LKYDDDDNDDVEIEEIGAFLGNLDADDPLNADINDADDNEIDELQDDRPIFLTSSSPEVEVDDDDDDKRDVVQLSDEDDEIVFIGENVKPKSGEMENGQEKQKRKRKPKIIREVQFDQGELELDSDSEIARHLPSKCRVAMQKLSDEEIKTTEEKEVTAETANARRKQHVTSREKYVVMLGQNLRIKRGPEKEEVI
jgi:hypothetical protein